MRFNEASQFPSRDNSNFRTQNEFQQVCITLSYHLKCFLFTIFRQTSIQQNTNENFSSQPPAVSSTNAQVNDEQDVAFMKHFEEWQTGFEKWRDENKNHPDKIQYKKYEDQFLTVRDQLTAVSLFNFIPF